MINVVNKYKHKPTQNDVYIGRGSVLGNPFTHLDLNGTKAQVKCETREEAIDSYEKYLRSKISEKDQAVCDELNRIYLQSKKGEVNLVCFCTPKTCHGDIIKKVVEEAFFFF